MSPDRSLPPTAFDPRSLVLVASLLALVLPAAPSSAQLSARQLIGSATSDYGPQFQDVEKAVAAFRAGDAAGARKSLQSAKKKNPQLAPADVMLAQLMFSAGNVRSGRAVLERAASDAPGDPEPLVMFGDLALRSGRLTEADTLFARTLEVCGKFEGNDLRKSNISASAYAGLATVAEARGDWKAAAGRIDDWIEAAPKSAAALLRLAQVRFRMKDRPAALAAFEAARKLDPSLPHPKINLALMHRRAGDGDEAKELMLEAAKGGPKDIAVQLAAAAWALDSGEIDLAKKYALAAQALDEKSVPAMIVVGIVSRHYENPETAAKWFDAALAKSPGDSSARNHMALALIDSESQKERVRALGYAQLNAQVNSDLRTRAGRGAAMTLAWIEFRLGYDALAQRQAKAVLAAGGIGPESAYHAARIYHAAGEDSLAAELYGKALAATATFPGRFAAKKLHDELAGAKKSTPGGAAK